MTTIYRYLGRCTVGDTYKLNFPDPVFSDPRGGALNKYKDIQYFTDSKFIQEGPIDNPLLAGTRELESERFRILGDPTKNYSIETGIATFPTSLQEIVDVIKPEEVIHFISLDDMIENTNHVYLLNTEQFDQLRNHGWRPAQPIDESHINNRSYSNGDDFYRDVEPANIDSDRVVDPPSPGATEI
jgi:hypothetical protein